MVSLMLPISIKTFMVVANPTIKAPGADCDTPSKKVLLILVASILEMIPQPKAIIKNIADNSLIPQLKLNTP